MTEPWGGLPAPPKLHRGLLRTLQFGELSWCGQEKSITIGRFRLTDPMVYVSTERGPHEEASCIDLSLPVGDVGRGMSEGLGEDPSYAGMSPNQRAIYLLWLSRGRVGPLSEIGYVLLYFYGLERRLIIDRQDLSPIVKEVVRLLEHYKTYASLDDILRRFLAFVLARAGVERLRDKWFHAVFDVSLSSG